MNMIDIILIVFVLLIVLISAKKGFLRALLDMTVGIVSVILSRMLSPVMAKSVYDWVIKARIAAFFHDKIADTKSGISDLAVSLSEKLSFIPESVLNKSDINTMVSSMVDGTVSSTQLESFIAPAVIFVLQLILFSLLSTLLLIVLSIVGKSVIKMIKKSKLTGSVDTALGAVLGFFKGAVYGIVIATVLSFIGCLATGLGAYTSASVICSFVSKIIGI